MVDQNEVFEVVFDNFHRGMVTNVDDPQKGDGAYKLIENARTSHQEGSLVKRHQNTYYNETSLGSNPVKSGVRYYHGSIKELIISYDTMLKKGDDDLGTFSDIKTGLTANQKFDFVTYKGKLYCFNGEDSNLVYDGTNMTNMGCPVPGSVPTTSLISGSLTGTFKYKVTYLYDGYQESNPSEESSAATPSGQGVRVTIPVSSDPRVTARKIYRTQNGGEIFYYVETVNNNTATTCDDTTADADLGDEVSTNHDEPRIAKMAILHKDRIFLLRPDSCEIDFTSIENYNSLPDIYDALNNTVKVYEDDGENVLAIVAIEEGILCFKNTMTYLIQTYSQDPLSWSIIPVDNHGTCCSWAFGKVGPGSVIYISLSKENEKELRLYRGGASINISHLIKDFIDTIQTSRFDDVDMQYYANRLYISYADNFTGVDYENTLLILEFADNPERYSFVVDSGNIACFIPCFGKNDTGQMYAGHSNAGRVLRLETPSTDIVHRTHSQISTGTITRLSNDGTDEYPEYVLDPDSFVSGGAPLTKSNTAINLWSSTINSLSGLEETIDHLGYITSDVLYINASTLKKAYWTITHGDNATSYIQLRTGDTPGAVAAASWSSIFRYAANGVDISSVSPQVYIQYRLHVASDDLPDAVTKLYRNNFVVKISAGLGSQFESYIKFVLDSGKQDLGYKGYIKRIRAITLEYAGEGNDVYLFLAQDEEDYASELEVIDLDTYPFIREINLPFDYFCEYLKFKVLEESLLNLKIKSIRVRFSVYPYNTMTLRR
jgi:hypothetical protein